MPGETWAEDVSLVNRHFHLNIDPKEEGQPGSPALLSCSCLCKARQDGLVFPVLIVGLSHQFGVAQA